MMVLINNYRQIRAFDAYMNVTFAAQNITGPKTMSGSVGRNDPTRYNR